MNAPQIIADALSLIASVPGFELIADDLRRAKIRFDPGFPDRGDASLRGVITLGPELFSEAVPVVSVAATLVHEHFHTRQNPFLKTVSFWTGIATKTPTMSRFERPAYARQAEFLDALAAAWPEWADAARRERDAVNAAYGSLYGGTL